MEMMKDRVLAYDLATIVEISDLEEVTGGFTIHMPTVRPSGYDLATLDMDLDR